MGCTCSKKKKKEPIIWEWKSRWGEESLSGYAKLLDARRDTLLSEIESPKNISQKFVEEWIDLTQERDTTQRRLFFMEEETEIIDQLLDIETALERIVTKTSATSVLKIETISALRLTLKKVGEEISHHPAVVGKKTYSGQNTDIATEDENEDEVFVAPPVNESLFETPQIAWNPKKEIIAEQIISSLEKLPRREIRSLPESPMPPESDPGGYRTPTASVSNSMETARSSLLSPYKAFNTRSKRYLGGAGQAYKQWMGGVPALSENHRGSREDIAEVDDEGTFSDTSVD